MQSGLTAPKEVCIQAAEADRHWCRWRDIWRQTVPNVSCGNWTCSVTDSWWPCMADNQRCDNVTVC